MTYTKRCWGCSSDLPLGDFYRRSASPDGHSAECKECLRERQLGKRHELREELEKLLSAGGGHCTIHGCAVCEYGGGVLSVKERLRACRFHGRGGGESFCGCDWCIRDRKVLMDSFARFLVDSHHQESRSSLYVSKMYDVDGAPILKFGITSSAQRLKAWSEPRFRGELLDLIPTTRLMARLAEDRILRSTFFQFGRGLSLSAIQKRDGCSEFRSIGALEASESQRDLLRSRSLALLGRGEQWPMERAREELFEIATRRGVVLP